MEEFDHVDSPDTRPGCRYWRKRTFSTREMARSGARNIKRTVEAHGGTYTYLYPYPCPDEDHWHLSHLQQGWVTCSYCRQRVRAWKSDDTWVIIGHILPGRGPRIDGPCPGADVNFNGRA